MGLHFVHKMKFDLEQFLQKNVRLTVAIICAFTFFFTKLGIINFFAYSTAKRHCNDPLPTIKLNYITIKVCLMIETQDLRSFRSTVRSFQVRSFQSIVRLFHKIVSSFHKKVSLFHK